MFTTRLFNKGFFRLLKTYLSLILLWFCVLFSQAQKYDIPIGFTVTQDALTLKSSKDSLFHTGVRPFNQWFLSNESFNRTFKDTGDYYYDVSVLLFQKHLLEIHKKDVHIGMDLLLNLQYGRNYSENIVESPSRISTNTRGFRIVGNIGKNVSFETRFYENQFFYANYYDSLVDRRDVAPGYGRVKAFKTDGWDVGASAGTVSFKASDLINVKFGHDHLFIGHGYRSLLLSDYASNYPFLQFNIRSKNQKWQYMSTYAWMQSLTRSETVVSTEALFKRKNANFHYLSYKPTPSIELGLFEGTIYKRFDDSLGFVAPNASFYNPIIGVNTLLNGLQGTNNALVGLSFSYLHRAFEVYSQLALDDIDRVSFQVGGKWFNPLGLDRNWILMEVNSVPEYMYSHNSDNLLQSYSHMNQELAHPIGASFTELTVLYHFYKNRWFANAQFNFSKRKRGSIRQLGENILRASDDILIGTSIVQDVLTYYWKLEGGYNFNIKTRLQLFGQVSQRTLINLQNSARNQNDFFFTFGIRCNLNNTYFDL